MMVLGLFAPGEGQSFIAAAVGQPLGFSRSLSYIREQSPADSEVDTLPRQFDRSSCYTGFSGGKRKSLVARRGDDGHIHIKRQHRPPWVRKQNRNVRSTLPLRPRYQRNLPAVQVGLSHQQARGHWDAHPAIFQYLNGEGGPP